MTEITLRSKHFNSLKRIVEDALSERLRELEAGINRTQERLESFENQYQMKTTDFLKQFENNQLQHSLDFDEWIGETWMLTTLMDDKKAIEEIEFVD